jgi:hypothetical protein
LKSGCFASTRFSEKEISQMTMKQILRNRQTMKLRMARFFVLVVLIGALISMPWVAPEATRSVEAGCFINTSSQCDLISSIELTWTGINPVTNGLTYSAHFTGQPQTLWGGICGPGQAEPLSVSPCAITAIVSKRTFNIEICAPYATVYTVNYRLSAYIGNENTPRKWLGSFVFGPTSFSGVGQTIVFPC